MQLNLLVAMAITLVVCTSMEAQTTGVPGINDVTVNGVGSKGTSCIPVKIQAVSALTVTVSSGPNSPVFFWISPNACTPGAFQIANPCIKQTFDLDFASSVLISAGVTDATGALKLSLSSCPGPVFWAMQAMIFDTNCGLVLSQAFDVKCE